MGTQFKEENFQFLTNGLKTKAAILYNKTKSKIYGELEWEFVQSLQKYCPLHTGHIYHINSVKNFADIIIILSGHTVQRGEFSIFNKWTKNKSSNFI